MSDQQMILDITFPTWDQLPATQKSLISFFMKDATCVMSEVGYYNDEGEFGIGYSGCVRTNNLYCYKDGVYYYDIYCHEFIPAKICYQQPSLMFQKNFQKL